MEISDEQLELQKKAKEYLEAKGNKEDNGEEGRGKKRKRKRTKEFDDDASSGSESSGDEEEEDAAPPGAKKEEEEGKEKNGDEAKVEAKEEEGDKKEEESKENDDEKKEEGKEDEDSDGKKPRALHRTASIFLRSLNPSITKQEVEAMCKRYPGFLRAAIADPAPDRRWFRRGWVTFQVRTTENIEI